MSSKRVLFLLLSVCLFFVFVPSVNAQVLYADFGVDYTQNFDSLASSSNNATFTWTDNLTIVGWYSSRTIYRVGAGTVTNGDLYSFGASGDSDRALGSIGSNATGTIQYGVDIQNKTGATISQVTLSYTGEQWRDGGGATAVPNTLTFAYSIDATSLTSGTYTNYSALSFTGPKNSQGTAAALNGNASDNRISLSSTITGLSLAPGSDLWLRWSDPNDTGNDHGIAIDDLRFSARPAAAVATTPEPGLPALFSGLILSGFGVLRSFRRSRRIA